MADSLTKQQKLRLDLFERLAKSRFRSKFRLGLKEQQYVADKGIAAVLDHAQKFLTERLAPAEPKNDGSQTPMRGHPVFVAQHATGLCCRTCLRKWHGYGKGKELTPEAVESLVEVIATWLSKQPAVAPSTKANNDLLSPKPKKEKREKKPPRQLSLF